ncbi:eukaryotic translation initiation factor 4B-like [Oncorhynchus nerka]|uniref:eukaryotic translation initiation factor 4B-like n=1 Tax=Oncorhynchus nerka TaxID=8023 RepID=UPI0031B81520
MHPQVTPTKPTSSWAKETDDLDTEVSTSWHTEEDTSRAPAIDRSILPTAPRSARAPAIDRSILPTAPRSARAPAIDRSILPTAPRSARAPAIDRSILPTAPRSARAPAIDRSILPTAPRSAREPNVDRSCIPRGPPYTAFLGNLPYDVTEDSIMDFFRGVGISAVHLPREPSNQDRSKGFGYAEFDDVESLLSALSLNKENFGNRRILVDIADWSCWI